MFISPASRKGSRRPYVRFNPGRSTALRVQHLDIKTSKASTLVQRALARLIQILKIEWLFSDSEVNLLRVGKSRPSNLY